MDTEQTTKLLRAFSETQCRRIFLKDSGPMGNYSFIVRMTPPPETSGDVEVQQ